MSKSKKPQELPKIVEVSYPTDSVIILFNTITEVNFIINELRKNKVLIVDKSAIILTEEQSTQLMKNSAGIWNQLYEILNRPETPLVINKGKGSLAPTQSKNKGPSVPIDNNVPLNCPPFIANNKIMILRVQCKNCVQVVNDLLGPFNPSEYTDKCIRKMFPMDFPASIYTSTTTEISKKDIEYIYVKLPLSLTTEKKCDLTMHQEDKISKKEFFNFVFPEEMAFPNSTYRMFAYALLGPFSSDGSFRGGKHGNYKMNQTDLNSYIQSLMNEDIVSIYLDSKVGLTKDEIDRFVSNSDYKIKNFRPYTKEEIETLLKDVHLDEYDQYSFHQLQTEILKIREKRIRDLKMMFPPLITKKHRYDYPTSNQLFPRLDDVAVFNNTAQLISRHSCEVTELGTNDYLVKSNVMIVRSNYIPPSTNYIPNGFHHLKALTGTQTGSYVKKSYQVQNK